MQKTTHSVMSGFFYAKIATGEVTVTIFITNIHNTTKSQNKNLTFF